MIKSERTIEDLLNPRKSNEAGNEEVAPPQVDNQEGTSSGSPSVSAATGAPSSKQLPKISKKTSQSIPIQEYPTVPNKNNGVIKNPGFNPRWGLNQTTSRNFQGTKSFFRRTGMDGNRFKSVRFSNYQSAAY